MIVSLYYLLQKMYVLKFYDLSMGGVMILMMKLQIQFVEVERVIFLDFMVLGNILFGSVYLRGVYVYLYIRMKMNVMVIVVYFVFVCDFQVFEYMFSSVVIIFYEIKFLVFLMIVSGCCLILLIIRKYREIVISCSILKILDMMRDILQFWLRVWNSVGVQQMKVLMFENCWKNMMLQLMMIWCYSFGLKRLSYVLILSLKF